ncbi:hypothetical protein EPIB2_992 [Tritonibacter mobilis]|nr:hypothetical protein EPIB2_992 [Tritonibacter mobilis]
MSERSFAIVRHLTSQLVGKLHGDHRSKFRLKSLSYTMPLPSNFHTYTRSERNMKQLLSILASLGAFAFPIPASAEGFWDFVCGLQARPQNPHTRPYQVHKITIPGGDDTVVLAGELTLPHNNGPFPGVVLVSGSAIVDRNSRILGHKPFLVLADHLTRQGYAVLRYDDRGFGGSSGDTYAALDSDFAADAAAAFSWLVERRDVVRARSGYIGHSQGGNKSLLAAQLTNSAFLVHLGSGVQPIETLLLEQNRVAGAHEGLSAELIARQSYELRSIFAILHRSETVEAAAQQLEAWATREGATKRQAKRLSSTYATPWMHEQFRNSKLNFAQIDETTATLLSRFSGPVLALYGEKDLLVGAATNHPLTPALLTNPLSSVITMRNVNHFFQPAENGTIEEMCETEITIEPKVLETIADWLDKVLSKRE